ncbi:hypothetical protein WDU94_002645 [Cyamophila willieti]
MAETEDDQWLYGDQTAPNNEEVNREAPQIDPKDQANELSFDDVGKDVSMNGEVEAESGQQQSEANGEKEEGEEDDDEDDDDDSDDDNVNIVIGDIRSTPAAFGHPPGGHVPPSIGIKRGTIIQPQLDKGLRPQGKFTVEEFEQIGTINSTAPHEFNLDTIEDKPWRKPGSDITDYF